MYPRFITSSNANSIQKNVNVKCMILTITHETLNRLVYFSHYSIIIWSIFIEVTEARELPAIYGAQGCSSGQKLAQDDMSPPLSEADYAILENVASKGIPKTTNPKHVCIVGAGMAGLVSGYVLKNAGHKVSIAKNDIQCFSENVFCLNGNMVLNTSWAAWIISF